MAATAPAQIIPFSPVHFYRCTNCGERMHCYEDFEESQHAACGGLVKLEPPPPPTALDDARRFLELHPWATSDSDNPVELLAALVKEIDDADDEEETAEPEAPAVESDAPARVEKLLAFIKGLRESCKISEQEYRGALAIVAD